MTGDIQDIQIIGEGNVAFHLATGFSLKKEIRSLKIISRHNAKANRFKSISDKVKTGTLEQFDESIPLTILAVADDAIPQVAQYFMQYENLIVHTAGSISIETLGNLGFSNYGSFYPLQTFSLKKNIDWSEIPIFVNSNTIENTFRLESIAHLLSNKVKSITDEQRLAIHIGAVFVNNFTNHLFTLSDQWLKDNELDFSIMIPLINETVEKIKNIDPYDAQTGPALRSDNKVLEKHLEKLNDSPNLKGIYEILSQSIKSSHKK